MRSSSKKKKFLWQQYVAMAFFVLIGAACGFFMVMYVDTVGDGAPLHESILTLAGLFLWMYVAILLQLILHEAGHLLAGLLSGYTFSSFRVFSLMWVKESGRIRLKRLHVAGTAGQCLMAPPEMKDGRIPLVLYNLGGSLMNLAAGAAALVCFLLLPRTPLLSAMLLMFAVIGFVFAMMNGIPMRLGMVDNDGFNAFALTRNPEAMRAFWVQMKVNEQISLGVRLREMPEAWFAFPDDCAMQNSMVAALGVFACNRLLDTGDFTAADERMAHMLAIDSGMVGLHRNLLILDRIYVELITRNRPAVIDSMRTAELKKFMAQMKTFPSVLRTEYACALLHEGSADRAAQIAAQFEKCARHYPYPSEIDAERELMQRAAAQV